MKTLNTPVSLTIKELSKSGDQYKAIGVSTQHLTASDREQIEILAKSNDYNTILHRETGWIVKLYETEEKVRSLIPLSETFHQLASSVLNAGFRLIEFDLEGLEYEHLPLFE